MLPGLHRLATSALPGLGPPRPSSSGPHFLLGLTVFEVALDSAVWRILVGGLLEHEIGWRRPFDRAANLMSQIVTSRLQIYALQYVTTYCLLQGRRAELCEIPSCAELEKPSFASERR